MYFHVCWLGEFTCPCPACSHLGGAHLRNSAGPIFFRCVYGLKIFDAKKIGNHHHHHHHHHHHQRPIIIFSGEYTYAYQDVIFDPCLFRVEVTDPHSISVNSWSIWLQDERSDETTGWMVGFQVGKSLNFKYPSLPNTWWARYLDPKKHI